MEQFTLQLKSAEFITDRTKHFVFSRIDGKKLNFTAGQFISLLIKKDEKYIKRNYSLANTPYQDTLEFSCSYIMGGLASEVLFNMNIGDEILAAGPFGLLVIPTDKVYPNYFFFATGTGVTPCLSMLPDIKEKILDKGSKFHLVFGVRTKKDLLYRENFIDFAKSNQNFKLHICYSREEDSSQLDNSIESLGRVQSKIKELNITNNDISFLCGNPNMVDEVFSELQSLEIERRNIKREKYISAKS